METRSIMTIIKDNITEIVILTMVIALLFYSSEPVLYSDAQRFLGNNFNHPPLYTIIVKIITSIFTTLNSTG